MCPACGASWSRHPTPQADAAPSDPLRAAVESMVTMLEEAEWAEHVSTFKAPGDALASRLESAITDLHNQIDEARAAIAAGVAQEPVGYFIRHDEDDVWQQVEDRFANDADVAALYRAAPLPRVAATVPTDFRDESILSWLRNLRGTGGCNAAAIEHIEELYERLAASNGE